MAVVNSQETVLRVRNLRTSFFLNGGRKVTAVDGVGFDLYAGETLGVVGESGSGKSVMVKSILNLIPLPGKIESGEVYLGDTDLLKLDDKKMQKIRGKEMSMIFQEPMSALNPSFSIAWQIGEVYRLHGNYTKKQIHDMTVDMLKKVKIPDPGMRMKQYPHQFSGGMRQRVLIAIALVCNPRILFADEPTTALDVTVQADIMDLLEDLKNKFRVSIVLISHNLNMVTERSDRIIVIYAGKIQEIADSKSLVTNPLHPYTIGLMDSIPNIADDKQKLTAIPGELPDLTQRIPGCGFSPRCKFAFEKCFKTEPELIEISPGHFCRCHLHNKSISREGAMAE